MVKWVKMFRRLLIPETIWSQNGHKVVTKAIPISARICLKCKVFRYGGGGGSRATSIFVESITY
jgi:hypothetical protein